MTLKCEKKGEKKEILRRIDETESIDEILKYTNYEDGEIRLKAVA